MIDHSLLELIKSYKINMKNWKLADIDNYMNGNSLFSEI
jgi:hypothetical protein